MSNNTQKVQTTYTESMAGFNGFAQGKPVETPKEAAPVKKTYDVDSSSMRGFTVGAPR